jgi:hypothetical protein
MGLLFQTLDFSGYVAYIRGYGEESLIRADWYSLPIMRINIEFVGA